MRISIWLIVLVLGVCTTGCGEEKAEIKPDQKSFWAGYWKMNPKSVEFAQESTVGMAFFEDGSYQDGSYNKNKFYPMSDKKGKWDLSDKDLLIIDGRITNKAVYTILSNGGLEMKIHNARIFLYKATNIIE